MHVYKPQNKPQGRALVPPYTSAGSARAPAGVGSWQWVYRGVRWEAACPGFHFRNLHMPMRLGTPHSHLPTYNTTATARGAAAGRRGGGVRGGTPFSSFLSYSVFGPCLYVCMYIYVHKPQLKPQGRARVASGEPPVACRHGPCLFCG